MVKINKQFYKPDKRKLKTENYQLGSKISSKIVKNTNKDESENENENENQQ